MSDALITLNNISLSHNGKNILDDVSFKLHPGEFITLIGPNGAGKSSLIKILLGVIKQDSGEIWSEKIPFYWSGKTIYAESTLMGKAMNMKQAIDHFNYEYLYASCLVFDIRYKDRIIKCISEHIKLFNRIKILYYFILIWVDRSVFSFEKQFSFIVS